MVQEDLFNQEQEEKSLRESHGKRFARFMDRYLQIRMDRLIMVGLAFFILLILVYSLGFERGVKVSMEKGTKLLIEEWLKPKPSGPIVKTVSRTEQLGQADEPSRDMELSHPPSQDESGRALQTSTSAATYTIQLITYISQERAEKEVSILAEKGFEGFVIPSGRYYIVCANRYDCKEDAIKALKQIRSETAYTDAYIRRLAE